MIKKNTDTSSPIRLKSGGFEMCSDETVLEFRNVSFTYPGRSIPALRDISFDLKKGRRILILGSNGSGKSTLTRLMTGLIRPDTGTVRFAGLSTEDRKNFRSIRSRAGLLFQNPSSQIVATVVREDTAFGPENLALSSKEIRSRVEEALKRSGLYSLRRRSTHDLSAGQQQRLALAGVLALGSGCLILDEAASMLNPTARREMDQLLDQLHEKGYTIIQVSHFMHQIARAGQILVFREGELVFNGGQDQFLEQSSSLESWSLKLPEVQKLSLELGTIRPEIRPVLDEALLAADLALDLKRPGPPHVLKNNDDPVSNGDEKEQSSPLISLRNVSYSYHPYSPRPVEGLKDLDFDFYRGETVVLMGNTGSGKSTFLQILNSLLLPSKGTIRLLGENPLDRNCDLARLRTRIGLVMQQPEKQLFAPLAGDDVAFGPRQMGLSGRELSLRVKEALEQMGLSYKQFRDMPVKALSGGQKRKVALAGILAMKPEFLLLDEPTAGLDPCSAENLEDLLLSLRKEGIHLILSTHDAEQALRFSPRLLVMEEGRKAFDGTAPDFFKDHDPAQFGLEYPLALRLWKEACPGWRESLPLTSRQLIQQFQIPASVSPEAGV